MPDAAFDRLRARRDNPIRFAHCLPFDVLATHIDSNLTNFVCTLFLNSTAGAGDKDITKIFDELGSNANRKKIAITSDSAGYLQCPVELEQWTHASKVGVAHFLSPADSASINTRYYFWYDHAVVDNSVYVGDPGDVIAAKVWDDGFYRLVQHLWAVGGIDSTRRNNGTVNSAPTLQDGQVGKCLDFDGADDYIKFAHVDDNDLDFKPDTDEFTISLWAKWTSGQRIFAKSHTGVGNQYQLKVLSGGDACATVGSVGEDTNGTEFADNEWHYMVLRNYLVGATMKFRIYIDGIAVGSEQTSGNQTCDVDALIGASRNIDNTDHTQEFEGMIDELRVSRCARSAAEIKAAFHAQNDTLVNWI